MLAASYPFAPIKGAPGDNIVAFPYNGREHGFWLLSDYLVSSLAAGTVWLLKRG